MTAQSAADKRPFWLMIEDEILELSADSFSNGNLEETIQKTARALEGTGINVAQNAGNMLQLRGAVDARVKVGRPLLEDFNNAVDALTLEDVNDTYAAAVSIINRVGEAWPKLKESERKPDVIDLIDKKKFDLVVAHASQLGGEPGIRFMIEEEIESAVIIESLGVAEDEFARVNAAVEAERAERTRVLGLIEEVADKSDEEKAKHLISSGVANELITELAGIDAATLEAANKAMAAEMAEKKRLEEEEAARKKAEAEGPPIEDIPADELLEYIESVREILEFSDVEGEIRAMCDQSSIPKALVDIAVSDAGKLDELEAKAEAGS